MWIIISQAWPCLVIERAISLLLPELPMETLWCWCFSITVMLMTAVGFPRWCFLRSSCVPGPGLSSFHRWSHSTLWNMLRNRYGYRFHLLGSGEKLPRHKLFLVFTRPVNHNARSPVCLSPGREPRNTELLPFFMKASPPGQRECNPVAGVRWRIQASRAHFSPCGGSWWTPTRLVDRHHRRFFFF